MPQSVLNEITELPLLKRALERAKPVDNEPKTAQNARFTAGVGHDYAQIIVDKQPSTKILKGIERIAAKYPSLKAGLHQLEYHQTLRKNYAKRNPFEKTTRRTAHNIESPF